MIYDTRQLQKDIDLIATVLGTYLIELCCCVYKQGPLTYYYRVDTEKHVYAIYINETAIEIPSEDYVIHTASIVGNTTLTLAMKAEEFA